jgi:hypothetical protein
VQLTGEYALDYEALSIKNDMIGPLEYNGKPSNDGLDPLELGLSWILSSDKLI